MVEGLIGVAASPETQVCVPQENLQTLSARLLALLDQGELDVPKHLRKELRRLLNGQLAGQRSSVTTLINIAAILGVTPSDLIVTPENVVNARLLNDTTGFKSLPLARGDDTLAVRLLVSCLEDLVENHFGMLPALHIVAKQFRVNVTSLRQHFPEATGCYIEARATTHALSFRNSFRIGFQAAIHLLGPNSGIEADSDDIQLVSRVTTICRIDRDVAADAVSKARTVFKWTRKIERKPRVSHVEDSIAATWLENLSRG